MEHKPLQNVIILPEIDSVSLREKGLAHFSYLEETAFYSLIQQGNVEKVESAFDKLLSTGLVVGRLSEDPLRQIKYWAVCCVTLGTRYAIQGGLEESTAFSVADECIRKIDKSESGEQIAEILKISVLEATRLVQKSSFSDCPIPIMRCLKYIEKNVLEKITLANLATEAGYSLDYTSKLFKKYTGQTVQKYVLTKKLETAKNLLSGECDQAMLGYYLGFCSQTYFITCFKKAYGVTPHNYAKKFRPNC